MTDPVRVTERYEVLRPLGRGAFGRGDPIQVLYLPNRNYDSVIISTS